MIDEHEYIPEVFHFVPDLMSVAHSSDLKLKEAVVVSGDNTEFIKVNSYGVMDHQGADVQLGALHDNVVPVYVRMEPALGIWQGQLDPRSDF